MKLSALFEISILYDVDLLYFSLPSLCHIIVEEGDDEMMVIETNLLVLSTE